MDMDDVHRIHVHDSQGGGSIVGWSCAGGWCVQVNPVGHRSLYPKFFLTRQTALAHMDWVHRHWSSHVKSLSPIRTTYKRAV